MLDTDIITIVSEEIAYFLTIENQAAIPGFGRFMSVNQSATLNNETNLLAPPTSKITFEQNLEEADTRFTDYFGDYHDKGDRIDDFIVSFINKIKEEQSILLPELGRCILTKEGAVHFESLDASSNALGFEPLAIAMKPLPDLHVVTKPEGLNTPGEAAMPTTANSRSRMIRIGMVLSSVVLLMVFVYKFSWPVNAAEDFQKVSTNYNVSPQDQDVIIASMDGDAPTGEISEERRNEILERQRLMSEAIPEPEMRIATIVTNTFGNERNVEKQLAIISKLGYQGSVLEKPNGLVSTLITIEYQKQEELDKLFDEIKESFHRAKLKK